MPIKPANLDKLEDMKMLAITGKAIVVTKTTGKAGCFNGLFLSKL